jgi:hypothetical protein
MSKMNSPLEKPIHLHATMFGAMQVTNLRVKIAKNTLLAPSGFDDQIKTQPNS